MRAPADPCLGTLLTLSRPAQSQAQKQPHSSVWLLDRAVGHRCGVANSGTTTSVDTINQRFNPGTLYRSTSSTANCISLVSSLSARPSQRTQLQSRRCGQSNAVRWLKVKARLREAPCFQCERLFGRDSATNQSRAEDALQNSWLYDPPTIGLSIISICVVLSQSIFDLSAGQLQVVKGCCPRHSVRRARCARDGRVAVCGAYLQVIATRER